MPRNLNHVFNEMVDSMCSLAAADRLLDSCMDLDEEAIRYVPLRYRIIALGFVKGFTLEELNEKLLSQGCPKLYSRNFWEAVLIFAFKNGYSYEQWGKLRRECAVLYEERQASKWFGDKKITYGELERYVLENSDTQGDLPATKMQTHLMEKELSALDGSAAALKGFLLANIAAFSAVREKTRYYFCKYLYYWLNTRIESYFDACRTGAGVEEALSGLLPLKIVTALRRGPNMPEEEKRSLICGSALSCGEIFDEFNYFYFGYVSVDWAEILMECCETVRDIPAAQKKDLAKVFRKNRPEWRRLSDEEVISKKIAEAEAEEDAAFAKEGSRGYGKNRAGELTVYKYIRGMLDIDRTVLVTFLMFLAYGAALPEEYALTPERLTAILSNCGYAGLDIENDTDWFVTEFLESRRPLDFLTEVMVGYAKQEENSFLYHVYGNSTRYEEELLSVMMPEGQKT